MKDINDELREIEKKINSPQDLSKCLSKLGIENHATETSVYMKCPVCEKENNLYVRVEGVESGYQWRCYKCKAHIKNYDSLVGLVRLFKNNSPYQAINLLYDATHNVDKKSTMKLPLGKHKGKSLSEIPPHYLKWLVTQNSIHLSDTQQIEIEDYILGI
ncbi:MAG: hypothetical protein GXP26_02855 [Planctomycetes bacterium]|nr:hypothetical protein [Planctomycetota bacterium]